MTDAPLSLYVLGTGLAGRALLEESQRAGVQVAGAWCPGRVEAEDVSATLEMPIESGPLPDCREARVVLVCVPDRAVAEVARELVERGRVGAEQCLLHVSGALPAAVMRTREDRPGSVGCFHPLQTLTAPLNARGNYHVAVEGEPAACDVARTLATALGHPVLTLDGGQKPLYHAAATVACNYLTTLEHAAQEIAVAAGIERGEAAEALGTLVEGTVAALRARGAAEGLTGPIARGDAETVRAHLVALEALSPELAALYRALGRRTLSLRKEPCPELEALL